MAYEPELLETKLRMPGGPPGIITTLSDVYNKELVSDIGWTKQVPGFQCITPNDQEKQL